MRRRAAHLAGLLLAVAPPAAHAAAAGTDPWSGSWTLDRARSTLVGTSLRILRIPGGYHFDFGAEQFDISDDGTFDPTIPGRTTSIRRIDDRDWIRIHRIGGRQVDHGTLRIMPDQRLLVIDDEAVTPDGHLVRSHEVDERVGPGQGLAGLWHSRAAGINVAATLSLQRLPDGRYRWSVPGDGNFFVVAPDGPPAVNQGARASSDITMSLRAVPRAEWRWTVFAKGAPFMEGTDRLQPDGSLVETSWPDQYPGERQRAVYRRATPSP